jgi:hypothetical protein
VSSTRRRCGNPTLTLLSLHLSLDATTLRGHALRPCQRGAASHLRQFLKPRAEWATVACSAQRLSAFQRHESADSLRATTVGCQRDADASRIASLVTLPSSPTLTFLPATSPRHRYDCFHGTGHASKQAQRRELPSEVRQVDQDDCRYPYGYRSAGKNGCTCMKSKINSCPTGPPRVFSSIQSRRFAARPSAELP